MFIGARTVGSRSAPTPAARWSPRADAARSPAGAAAICEAALAARNLPSVATPNGQAAFRFLPTSALAPLIRLSYARMVVMALSYTIALTVSGYDCVAYLI
jgi:Na+/H+ antiporter NhaB